MTPSPRQSLPKNLRFSCPHCRVISSFPSQKVVEALIAKPKPKRPPHRPVPKTKLQSTWILGGLITLGVAIVLSSAIYLVSGSLFYRGHRAAQGIKPDEIGAKWSTLSHKHSHNNKTQRPKP